MDEITLLFLLTIISLTPNHSLSPTPFYSFLLLPLTPIHSYSLSTPSYSFSLLPCLSQTLLLLYTPLYILPTPSNTLPLPSTPFPPIPTPLNSTPLLLTPPHSTPLTPYSPFSVWCVVWYSPGTCEGECAMEKAIQLIGHPFLARVIPCDYVKGED